MISDDLRQNPGPGTCGLAHCGDAATFTLELDHERRGTGWLRTNIGSAQVRFSELVNRLEKGEAILARDWHDIPMRRLDARRYQVVLPLVEAGRFEAKSFFLPAGENEPVWPRGDNTVVKVEAAESCCANSIYCAFVRQFGRNRSEAAAPSGGADATRLLEDAGHTVIPESGKFRDVIKELDFIVGKLRCRIVQLLPIHPTPTVYARMGRFGSPFAALDFMDVDPALAEFDRRTTPMDQFKELVDAVHHREARIFLDIPVNHTGWASRLQVENPEWFARNADRSFKSPGAWGVTWEDLSHLNYEEPGLWKYMADVFLFWCRHGVDGFRCDAGYMIPFRVWQYIVARVRLEYPATVFFLEGLGGKLEVVEGLLSGADLDWAYSELFQNYDRAQIENYLPGCLRTSMSSGVLVHFAETHDNNRLAAKSEPYARMRTALAALFSVNGTFGITNGVEWFAKDKVDVHEARPLNWGSEVNQVDQIARLNAILETHPCFYPGATLQMIQAGAGNSLALRRTAPDLKTAVLVLVNLGDGPEPVSWKWDDFPLPEKGFFDLVTGGQFCPERNGSQLAGRLEPGDVLCLTGDVDDFARLDEALARPIGSPGRQVRQRLQAKALEIHCFFRGLADISGMDVGGLADSLSKNPAAYCLQVGSGATVPALVRWVWPRDLKRMVMVPPGHILYVRAPHKFAVRLRSAAGVFRCESSLPEQDGSHFAMLLPPDSSTVMQEVVMEMDLFPSVAKAMEGGPSVARAAEGRTPDGVRHDTAPVLYLDRWEKTNVRFSLSGSEVDGASAYALCTNGRGAMAQVRARWGQVQTQYDALLAANLHPEVPVDRQVMFTRCRAWLVYRGYSHEINGESLEKFELEPEGSVRWIFAVPTGNGRFVRLVIRLRMLQGVNAIRLEFIRERMAGTPDGMEDGIPVRLILRPDIEDRNFHHKTKAYQGAEATWSHAVENRQNGFVFRPSGDHWMEIFLTPGMFMNEPEWHYMVGHPVDAERGLDGCSDLFSPGFFDVRLRAGERAELRADVLSASDTRGVTETVLLTADGTGGQERRLDAALRRSMPAYLVRRNDSRTIIAGYPWFLDWGRDTLICLRGMIAAGWLAEVRDVIRQFASREQHGTLPNMIRGGDDSNRDTSDAPLWLFAACADMVDAERSRQFMEMDCGGRVLREVLVAIANAYRGGTPNGIRMDPMSGLIFSPTHFTWMDTNFPASTPREGYPVEIQALWHRALTFLSSIDPDPQWTELADRVRQSVQELFLLKGQGYLADCLRTGPGRAARDAAKDDALRPNQLLAITLGVIQDPTVCTGILSACEELLVPGAIRSLADRPVLCELPVYLDGRLLNNPTRPYWGRYVGDEDTSRKPAYHNGTAWTWLFPSYSEALSLTCGGEVRDAALSILSSAVCLMNGGCLGHIPEVVDGDFPHAQRGCGAQAWGETELFRVVSLLTRQA